MSSAHSINARKCVYAQKPYPIQAFAHESNKVEGRGKREKERKDRGQEADGKKGTQKKTRTHQRNENKAYFGTTKVNKV